MKRLLWLALLIAGCSQPAPSPTPTGASSSPQAQTLHTVQFVLLDDRGKVTKDTMLKAPCDLMLRVKGEATVVLATFSGNQGDSPEALPPRVLRLDDEEDVVRWKLDKPISNGRLYVAVLPNDSANAQELSDLVASWTKKTAPNAQQVVHQRVVGWEQALDTKLVHAGQPTQEIGGVTSHSAFTSNMEKTNPRARPIMQSDPAGGGNALQKGPEAGKEAADWLPLADSVQFSADKPGVYSYPIQFATR